MQGAGHERGRGRVPARVPLVAAEDLDVGVLVEQHLAEVDGLDAVDERLVGLVEQRDPAVGEPLDEVDLPQRPLPVQRPRDDPGDQLAQLVGAARPGQRGAAYVVADVEVVVVDPDRVGEVAGDRLHPLPVARHERDPVEDQRHEPVVVEPGVTGVEDLDGGVVPRRGRGLELEEREVARAEPLAHRTPLSRSATPPAPRAPAFGRHGILTEVSGRPCSRPSRSWGPAINRHHSSRLVTLRRSTRCAVRSQPSPSSSAPSAWSAAATTSLRRRRHGPADEDDQRHHRGRLGHAERRPGRGEGRPADRAGGQGGRAGRDPRPLRPGAGARVRLGHHHARR